MKCALVVLGVLAVSANAQFGGTLDSDLELFSLNPNAISNPDHVCHEWNTGTREVDCARLILQKYCDTAKTRALCQSKTMKALGSPCGYFRGCYFKQSWNAERYEGKFDQLELVPDEFEVPTAQSLFDENTDHCRDSLFDHAFNNGYEINFSGNICKRSGRSCKVLTYAQVTPICASFGSLTDEKGEEEFRCKRYFSRCTSNINSKTFQSRFKNLMTPPPTRKPTPFPTEVPTTPSPTNAPTTGSPTPFTIPLLREKHQSQCAQISSRTSCNAMKMLNKDGRERSKCIFKGNKCVVYWTERSYSLYFKHLLSTSAPTPFTDAPTNAPSTSPTATPTVSPTDAPTTTAPTISCDIDCGENTLFDEKTGRCELDQSADLFDLENFGHGEIVELDRHFCGRFTHWSDEEHGCVADLLAIAHTVNAGPIKYEDGKFVIDTFAPTGAPSETPTSAPTDAPTDAPTKVPTPEPTDAPSATPTDAPTKHPTFSPTKKPTRSPTRSPTKTPTRYPTKFPTKPPTKKPTKEPTQKPTRAPTNFPTKKPTDPPTRAPTKKFVQCFKFKQPRKCNAAGPCKWFKQTKRCGWVSWP